MRRWIQARAGRLLAGVGILMTAMVAGCQNTPTLPGMGMNRPNANTNTNIPRTAVGNGMATNNGAAAGNMGNGAATGMGAANVNSANSMNRVTGPPMNPTGQVGMNMGAMAGPTNPAGAAGSPSYLNQPLGPPPGATISGVQPIATSNPPAARPMQPVNYNAPNTAGPLLDLDPTPSGQNAGRTKEVPSVPPISAADLDRPRNWQKPKSPQMADLDLPTLEPQKPPMPNPRGADTLGPPPTLK